MDQRGVPAFAASGAPALTERHPAPHRAERVVRAGGGQGGAPHGPVRLTPRMHVRHAAPSLGPDRHQSQEAITRPIQCVRWYGTSMTMVFGRKKSRAFRLSAVWLWSGNS